MWRQWPEKPSRPDAGWGSLLVRAWPHKVVSLPSGSRASLDNFVGPGKESGISGYLGSKRPLSRCRLPARVRAAPGDWRQASPWMVRGEVTFLRKPMDTRHNTVIEECADSVVEELYTPLPEALELLADRRRVSGSRRQGGWLPAELPRAERGYAMLSRWFATPNFETLHFLRMARNSGLHPVIEEYHGDKFVGHNPMKHALACLRFQTLDGKGSERLHVIDWAQQGRPMRQLVTLGGRPLAHFHREWLNRVVPECERPSIFECSDQYEGISGCVHAYYRTLLSLCVADGILFEDFLPNATERPFTQAVVIPAFRAIQEETGCRPLIARLCPFGTAHDSRWNSYAGELRPIAQSLLEGTGGLVREHIEVRVP